MTNPRIEQTPIDGVTKERIAVQTHIYYDPATGSAKIVFQAQPCLYMNDAFVGVAGDYETLTLDLAMIASDCYGTGVDPVTGADNTKVSSAGIVQMIKSAFAIRWDAQVDGEQQAAAEHAAVAAEMPSQAGAAS